MAHELRWLPAATFGDSQLSVTPAPGRSLPMSSSGTCTPSHIPIIKNDKNLFLNYQQRLKNVGSIDGGLVSSRTLTRTLTVSEIGLCIGGSEGMPGGASFSCPEDSV